GAVGIAGGLDLRVVLAVYRSPFLGHLAGRQPEPQAEEVRDERMQVKRTMRLAAVQINRDRGDRHMGHCEHRESDPPPREVEPTGERHGLGEPFNSGFLALYASPSA